MLFDVMPQRLADAPRAHNQNIARLDAAVVAAIHDRAPHQPPRAQQHRGEGNGQQHHGARYHLSTCQVQRAGQQQARREAGLDRQSLIVQSIAQLNRRVEMHAPADQNQRQREPAQIEKRQPWTVAQHGLCLEYGIVRNEISQVDADCQSRRNEHAQRVAKRPEHRNPNRMRPDAGTADRKWPGLQQIGIAPRSADGGQIQGCSSGEPGYSCQTASH